MIAEPEAFRGSLRLVAPRLVLTSLQIVPTVVIAKDFGPVFSGGVTVIQQQANDRRVDSNTTASADLFVTVNRTAGEWLVYLEGNSTPSSDGVASLLLESNADAGSALDEERRGRLQISEFNYTFRQSNGTLTMGLIDPSGYLDRSRITNDENVQFMGASFVNNPTIEFPDYSLGIAYQRPATNGMPDFNLVLSSSHGLADNPNLSYPQLLSINDNDSSFLSDDIARVDGDDTTQIELFYRLAMGENMHVTPSIQYLLNSGFDSSGETHDRRITIAGLRFHYAF